MHVGVRTGKKQGHEAKNWDIGLYSLRICFCRSAQHLEFPIRKGNDLVLYLLACTFRLRRHRPRNNCQFDVLSTAKVEVRDRRLCLETCRRAQISVNPTHSSDIKFILFQVNDNIKMSCSLELPLMRLHPGLIWLRDEIDRGINRRFSAN